MKIKKRIAAMCAAFMMMVSMSAVSASAQSAPINIHYVSSLSTENVTKNTWTYYTVAPTQTMAISSIQLADTSAYVELFNPMGINYKAKAVTTRSCSSQVGVKITARVELMKYSIGGYYASGTING